MLTLCLRPLCTLEKGTLGTSTLGLDEHCRKTRIHQDTPDTIAASRRPQSLHIASLAANDALRSRNTPALLQARCVPGISPLHDVKKSASRSRAETVASSNMDALTFRPKASGAMRPGASASLAERYSA